MFQCFPALGAFVLELAPLKQWHTLEIANHVPANQCLMTLLTKVKDVTEADQVMHTSDLCGAVRFRVSWSYTMHVMTQLYNILCVCTTLLQIKAIGQFSRSLLQKTKGLQPWYAIDLLSVFKQLSHVKMHQLAKKNTINLKMSHD